MWSKDFILEFSELLDHMITEKFKGEMTIFTVSPNIWAFNITSAAAE